MKHPAPRRAGGFTLLELLVVIVIFGIFATMAYGGLSSVLNARRRIEASLSRTADYQKAYVRLRDDFINGSGRAARDSDGGAQPPLLFDSLNRRLEFTRGGWSNPALLPRSTEERVSYYLDETESGNPRLVRRSWRVLDRAQQSEPVSLVVLDHVDKLEWRFLDKSQAWQSQWPAAGTILSSGVGNSIASAAAQVPPQAVELTMTTRDWGEIRLLFRFGPDGLGACRWGLGGSSGGLGSGGGSSSGSGGSSGSPVGSC